MAPTKFFIINNVIFFLIFQDDFLDLADDEHHADMALCLASGQSQSVSASPVTNQAHSSPAGNSTTSGLAMKAAESNGLVLGGLHTASNTTTSNVNHHHLVDNSVMKLDNLDNWDQDV